MESKRKKRQVPKVPSAIPAQPKSVPQQPKQPEALIRYNANLIDQLFKTPGWNEIAFPLLQELIASVSGRFTNGRYQHGTLTRDWSGNTSLFVAGYQKALMDFTNHLHDFIVSREKLDKSQKEKEEAKKAPVYNPFLEEENAEEA